MPGLVTFRLPMIKWLIISLAALLAGCSPSALIEKIADAEKVAVARAYIQRLSDGDEAGLIAELEPALRNGQEVGQFKAMRTVLPSGMPDVTNLVGYQVNYRSGEASYNVSFQFAYGSRWFVANAAWRERPNEPRQIIGMRVVPLERSLQETNAFTFSRAELTHYLVFTAALAIPIFIVWTLIVCIRTPVSGRKWLWVLFILVGFAQISLNWTTGEIQVKPLAFQLLGAGVFAAGVYAPWILSVSLPVGAIVFWVKRRKLIQAQIASQALENSKPET